MNEERKWTLSIQEKVKKGETPIKKIKKIRKENK